MGICPIRSDPTDMGMSMNCALKDAGNHDIPNLSAEISYHFSTSAMTEKWHSSVSDYDRISKQFCRLHFAPNLLPTCSREVGRQRAEFFLATGWTQPADPPAYPKVLAVLYSDEIV